MTDAARPTLASALETELAEIRRAPKAAIGLGEKAYLPYELMRGDALVTSADPAIVSRLASEALDQRNDLTFRFVVLQILAQRREPAVDTLLVSALADRELRPLAAYFLGRAGFKGYPSRDRSDVAPLLHALSEHLGDPGVYRDPWYGTTHATRDLVLGAVVRIADPESFTFIDPDERAFIGYTLRFPDGERAGLLEQATRRAAHAP